MHMLATASHITKADREKYQWSSAGIVKKTIEKKSQKKLWVYLGKCRPCSLQHHVGSCARMHMWPCKERRTPSQRNTKLPLCLLLPHCKFAQDLVHGSWVAKVLYTELWWGQYMKGLCSGAQLHAFLAGRFPHGAWPVAKGRRFVCGVFWD